MGPATGLVIPALAGIENKQKNSKKAQVQICRYSLGACQMCGIRRYRYMFAGIDILLGKQKKFSRPFIISGFIIIFNLFFGFIISLIVGLIVKKSKPE